MLGIHADLSIADFVLFYYFSSKSKAYGCLFVVATNKNDFNVAFLCEFNSLDNIRT
jgi:hypothetical protein